MSALKDEYLAPEELRLRSLSINDKFPLLNRRERLYAYWMYRAAWCGGSVVMKQTSPESVAIYRLIAKWWNSSPSKDDPVYKPWLNYAVVYFANSGNYLGFGDTKVIPRVELDDLVRYLSSSLDLTETDLDTVSQLYEMGARSDLGFNPDCQTTYYPPGMTKPEVKVVNELMVREHVGFYNTVVRKGADGTYLIVQASVNTHVKGEWNTSIGKVRLVSGGFSNEMKGVVDALTHAKDYVANDHQTRMLDYYIRHFTDGNEADHVESARHWVKDKGPVVETYLGFIENYRDPDCNRGEWEGFVAFVDKEMTKIFTALVDNAEDLLNDLNLPAAFEKDVFAKPDFTSLQILTYNGAGIPAGINIPNYDEVRQDPDNGGFKNVSLGNIVSQSLAPSTTEPVPFVSDEDQELFKKHIANAFEIQVGGHELLGHGSGKILAEREDGSLNFDPKTVDPRTGKPVATWYKPGETWSSKFGRISSCFEECRAECVGVLLCSNPKMLEIFRVPEDERGDMEYIGWFEMAYNAGKSMLMYSLDSKQWRQAHSQARVAIFNVFRRAGLVDVEFHGDEDDMTIRLDRSKIRSHGYPALHDFLLRLHVTKAVGDVEEGYRIFEEYSTPDDLLLKMRRVATKNRKPRPIYVQPTFHLSEDGSDVVLTDYDVTAEGAVASNLVRLKDLVFD